MSSCLQNYTSEAETKVTPISVSEAARYHRRAGVEFIDPRPVEAIAATTGLIPGARTISIADIEAGNLPPAFEDRSIRVIASCQAGPMGAKAAEAIAKLGFAHVNYIDGGTEAWMAAGLPTSR